jgi:16S rRNA (uracil1498-N3)-methyltransferase
VSGRKFLEKKAPFINIAISLLKNSSRFEWFLEKATEIGVDRFILLNCERTEKQRFRMERLKGVCIAAMLQSEQCWLPQITEPVPCVNVKMWKCDEGINMIAHCEKEKKTSIRSLDPHPTKTQLIAIGPEGDFSPIEIQSALAEGFFPVSLGETRLRTETAGIVAATLLKNYK